MSGWSAKTESPTMASTALTTISRISSGSRPPPPPVPPPPKRGDMTASKRLAATGAANCWDPGLRMNGEYGLVGDDSIDDLDNRVDESGSAGRSVSRRLVFTLRSDTLEAPLHSSVCSTSLPPPDTTHDDQRPPRSVGSKADASVIPIVAATRTSGTPEASVCAAHTVPADSTTAG